MRLRYLALGAVCILTAGLVGMGLHSIGMARAKSREAIPIYTEEELSRYLLDKESEDYNRNGRYRLEEDLELGWLEESIGTNIEPFTGKFDGNGHVISGLTRPLFGVLEHAEVERLFLSEVSIENPFTYYDGERYVDGYGALAAYAVDSSIRNCGMGGEVHTASPVEAEYQIEIASPLDADELKGPGVMETTEAEKSGEESTVTLEEMETSLQGPESSGEPGVETTDAGSVDFTTKGQEGTITQTTAVADSSEPELPGVSESETTIPEMKPSESSVETSGPDSSAPETETSGVKSSEPETGATDTDNINPGISETEQLPSDSGMETEVSGIDSSGVEAAERSDISALSETVGYIPLTRQSLKLKVSTIIDTDALEMASPPDAEKENSDETSGGEPAPGEPVLPDTTISDGPEEYTDGPEGDIYILVVAERIAAGGLVAEMAGDTLISSSFTLVVITSDSNTTASYAGGMAGIIGTASRIENSYVAGSMDTVGTVGGFAALHKGGIQNSYSTMIIGSNADTCGAFTATGDGTLDGCFYDNQMACVDGAVAENTVVSEGLKNRDVEIVGNTDGIGVSDITGSEEDHIGMKQIGPGEWVEAETSEEENEVQTSEEIQSNSPDILGNAQQTITQSFQQNSQPFMLKGLNTSEMTGAEQAIPGNWYVIEGAYPQLEYFASSENDIIASSSRASVIALKLPEGTTLVDSFRDGDIILPSEIDGQEIQWEAEGGVTIDENSQVTGQGTATFIRHELPEVGSALEPLLESELLETPKKDAEESENVEAASDASDEQTDKKEKKEVSGNVKLKASIGGVSRSFALTAVEPREAAFADWKAVGEDVENGGMVTGVSKPIQNSEGYYEIENEEQLGWFCYAVNNLGKQSINVKLMRDMNMFGSKYTGYTGEQDLANIEQALRWVPAGQNGFFGVFDGNGYEIDGLYMIAGDKVGLIGTTSQAEVKNLGIGVNSAIKGDAELTLGCGMIVGFVASGNWTEKDTLVTNCYTLGTVECTSSKAGILVGSVYRTPGMKLLNCYSAGHGRAVMGSGTIIMTNCYGDRTKDAGNEVPKTSMGEVKGVTTAQMQSWGFAYTFNKGSLDGPWSYISGGYPRLGKLQPPTWEQVGEALENGYISGYTKPSGSGSKSDPFQIGNAVQFGWYAYILNRSVEDSRLCADLTNDIRDFVGKEWGGTPDQPLEWTSPAAFRGTFGAGHSRPYELEGMRIVGANSYGGVFGKGINCKVARVGVANSTIEVSQNQDPNVDTEVYAGAVLGTLNNGTVSQCYSRNNKIEAITRGWPTVGGIVGCLYYDAIVEDCYSQFHSASDIVITAASTLRIASIGGICGSAANSCDYSRKNIVINCYSVCENEGYFTKPEVGSIYNCGFGNIVGYMNSGIFDITSCCSDGRFADPAEDKGGAKYLDLKSQDTRAFLNTAVLRDGTTVPRTGANRVWYSSLDEEATKGRPTLLAPERLGVTFNPETPDGGTTVNLPGNLSVPDMKLRSFAATDSQFMPGSEGESCTLVPCTELSGTDSGYYRYGTVNANQKLGFKAGSTDLYGKTGAIYQPSTDLATVGSITLYTAAAYTKPENRYFLLEVASGTTRYDIQIIVEGSKGKTLSVKLPIKVGIELESAVNPVVEEKSYSADLILENKNHYPIDVAITTVAKKEDKELQLPLVGEGEAVGKNSARLGLTSPETGSDTGNLNGGKYYYKPADGNTSESWFSCKIGAGTAFRYRYFMEHAMLYYDRSRTFGYDVTYQLKILDTDLGSQVVIN